MKDIAEMNYSEFTQFLDGEGFARLEHIYDEEYFSIYLDKPTGRYFYLEGGENDASEFYELTLLARLELQVKFDICDAENELNYEFKAEIHAERTLGDRHEHFWFDRKKQKKKPANPISTYKAVRLPWVVAANYIIDEINEILGYPISCRIAVDSYDYWGIAFNSYRMPTPELLKLLGALGIDGKTCRNELPNDEEGAKDTGDLSLDVAEILLKRAVPFEYDKYFFDEEDVWLLKCEDAEDKTDNLS